MNFVGQICIIYFVGGRRPFSRGESVCGARVPFPGRRCSRRASEERAREKSERERQRETAAMSVLEKIKEIEDEVRADHTHTHTHTHTGERYGLIWKESVQWEWESAD